MCPFEQVCEKKYEFWTTSVAPHTGTAGEENGHSVVASWNIKTTKIKSSSTIIRFHKGNPVALIFKQMWASMFWFFDSSLLKNNSVGRDKKLSYPSLEFLSTRKIQKKSAGFFCLLLLLLDWGTGLREMLTTPLYELNSDVSHMGLSFSTLSLINLAIPAAIPTHCKAERWGEYRKWSNI